MRITGTRPASAAAACARCDSAPSKRVGLGQHRNRGGAGIGVGGDAGDDVLTAALATAPPPASAVSPRRSDRSHPATAAVAAAAGMARARACSSWRGQRSRSRATRSRLERAIAARKSARSCALARRAVAFIRPSVTETFQARQQRRGHAAVDRLRRTCHCLRVASFRGRSPRAPARHPAAAHRGARRSPGRASTRVQFARIVGRIGARQRAGLAQRQPIVWPGVRSSQRTPAAPTSNSVKPPTGVGSSQPSAP